MVNNTGLIQASVSLLVFALALAACDDSRSARLVTAPTGAIVVHSTDPVRIPAAVVQEDGDTLSAPLSFALVSGEVVQLSTDGTATCTGMGDATVRVTSASLATNVTVLCRLVRTFYPTRGLALRLGSGPVAIPLGAVAIDGSSIDRFAADIEVLDTSIAAVDRAGFLHPRAAGLTELRISIGSCTATPKVRVLEPATSLMTIEPDQEFVLPDVQLVRGEVRYWRIPAGKYDVQLAVASDSAGLTLGVTDASCAPLRGHDQRFSCVARDNAALVIRHSPTSADSLGRGSLQVRRVSTVAFEDLAAVWKTQNMHAKCVNRL